jgi:hypothetical protein
MNRPANEYTLFFKEENQAKICINLADNQILDAPRLVRGIKGDRLSLELVGSKSVEEMRAEPGSDVFITFWTGWSLCRCSAVLLQKIYNGQVSLKLTGPVIEKQTREYFRLDLSIPFCDSMPEQQLLPAVHERWNATRDLFKERPAPVLVACRDGFKVVGWNGQREIVPRQVNLSGGGLKFKTSEYVIPGSLLTINLFLPLIPPRVIHTVAETLRCSEIMLSREKGNSYNTAVRFHFINEKDRETIIAFIFAEQRRTLGINDNQNYKGGMSGLG